MSKKSKTKYISNCCGSTFTVDPDSLDSGVVAYICHACGEDCVPTTEEDYENGEFVAE